MLEPGETVKVLATSKLTDPVDPSPGVIGNDLYLRTHPHLDRM